MLTVSISDSESEFSFVGHPMMIYENSQQSSPCQDGDNHSSVGDVPDDDPEEDAPRQHDETEDRHDSDEDDDNDEVNNGEEVNHDGHDDNVQLP